MRRIATWLVPFARASARWFYRIEQKLVRLSEQRLSDEDQWATWQSDIERIQRETTYAFESRLVFRSILEMYQNNPQLQQVYDWLKRIYGRDQVLAVRRELDRDSGVVNLIQLMYQIVRRQEVISRSRYLAHSQRRGSTGNVRRTRSALGIDIGDSETAS